jgi:hypothetical protein
MAKLLPADFDLSTLEHSEQRVCKAFLDGLDDTWIVVPKVPIVVDNADAEIDVVLVSPIAGVIVVEVKGGVIRLEQGAWFQNDRKMKKSPPEQVTKAKHALLRRMTTCHVNLRELFVCHAIALPDVGSVPAEGLGPDAPAEIVFAKPQLAFPDVAISKILRDHAPIPPERLAQFLAALRPDIRLDGSEGRVLQWAKGQLDEETSRQLASATGLDKNRRVLVTGGAGTGKTMLVQRWATRAVDRGERTLVVCFNRPIADLLRRLLDEGATVSTYHDVALQLLEPHGFRIGESPTAEYWRHAITDALEFHASKIGTPFDTIIIDEAQDFYPHWLLSLERLLDPNGPRKLLMAADPAQAIYVKPWTPPDDMAEMPLVFNLRNCGAIAKLVNRLGGPAPLPSAPFGDSVAHMSAGAHKEIRKRVRDAVTRLSDDYGLPFSQIAVLTTRTDVRDRLLAEPPEGCPLVRWEERTEGAILCETVQRTKGLESTAVVLVDMSGEPDPVLLYVGVSRAVCSLRLVGTPALAHAVGIPVG